MKKFFVVATVVCLALVMAAPAMATDISASGSYRIRSFATDSVNMNDQSASDAYFNMRFRLNTKFKVDDSLDFTARFDALDGKYYGMSSDAGTNWDRAFITYRTEVGTFVLGRQTGGAWGTLFADYESDADRLKWVSNAYGNWKFVLIYQGVAELDTGTAAVAPTYTIPLAGAAPVYTSSGTGAIATTATDDRDYNAFIGAILYNEENWKTGLLTVFYQDRRTQDVKTDHWRFNPYFTGNFGPLKINAELDWRTGDVETAVPLNTPDVDIDAWAANLEFGYDFGPFYAEIGYAYFSGDSNGTTDLENERYANGVGDDWNKLWILTNDEDQTIVKGLGGMGNFSKDGGNTTAGADIFYLGGSFAATETVSLNAIVGWANADKTAAGINDDYGTEFDFGVDWKIHDNLTYKLVFAYLDSGDFWKQGAASPNFADVSTLFQQLQITF